MKQWLLRRAAVRGGNVVHGRALHVGPGSIVSAPHKLSIGDDVYVGKHCTVQVDGAIGHGVLMANLVGIVGRRDHDATEVGTLIRSARWVGDHPRELSVPVCIHSDVWLGYGAVVLSGIHIGRSTIVAAGSVVTHDLPDNVVAAGNPARPLRARFSDDDYKSHWQQLTARGIKDIDCVSRG